ncbi:hypothetical protein BEP19_01750 [Ammoniphilus oxalaticus]|uniref:Uncharacterized protein n=1 Tax=Ammoniphilus oxalaticus TaxID=66863 RepID=A0A419SN07_9BACL|nr:hypothetical protein [Ammoniphilus oxalaticus]RKD25690.1 hypothetical protein BEP19_01750 [Ammoniphilus oxalaticus]
MYLNQQLWRKPQSSKRRRTPGPAPRPKPMAAKLVSPKQDPSQTKHSLLTIRNQMRGFREQLEQMEKTMDTLFHVMDAIEKLNSPSKSSGNPSNLLKSFQNIDFKQVMNLLQSPLVQALVETMVEEEPTKKE